MKSTKIAIQILIMFLFLGTSATLFAEQERTGWRGEPWRFSFKGYGWLPDAPVDISIDQTVVASLPESFDRILQDLEFAAMAEFEAHKGRVGFLVSPIYYKGDDSEHFTGPLGQARRLELDETVWLVDYGVSYEVGTWHLGKGAGSPTVTVAPFVGATYFNDDIKLDVAPGILDVGLRIRETIEFNTPIIGGSTYWRFSDRWSAQVGGHYGGFDVSDVNNKYQIFGVLEYQFKIKEKPYSAFAGYRYLHLDYEDGPLEIHVDIKGPLVGFGVDF